MPTMAVRVRRIWSCPKRSLDSALGILPRPDQHSAMRARPIGEVMDEYQAWGALQGGRGKRPWTPQHQANLARQLAWWCRQLQLHSLGDTLGILPAVERGLQHLAAQGRSPNTLNQYLASLHGFVAWCRERDYLREDPLQHLTWLPKTPRGRRRAMTIEEIQRLLEACRPERCLVYQTALMTGLRANELRQLSLEHLDVERCGLRLAADWTKNRQPEFQPLPRALVGALYASARSGEPQRCYARFYARPAGRRRISYPAVPLLFVPLHTETMLYDDLRRAGIPQRTTTGKLDFHALRVAYINLVMEHGATPPEAQQLARHRTVALTISPEYGYARTREPRLHALVEGIAQQILGTPQGASGVHARAVGEQIPQYGSGMVSTGQQILYLPQQDIITRHMPQTLRRWPDLVRRRLRAKRRSLPA